MTPLETVLQFAKVILGIIAFIYFVSWSLYIVKLLELIAFK